MPIFGFEPPSIVSRLLKRKEIKQAPLFSRDMFMDAQQEHRFLLRLDGIPAAFMTSADRPSYKIDVQEEVLLGHTLRFPKSVVWNPVKVTMHEIYTPAAFGSVMSNMMSKLFDIGYTQPHNAESTEERFLSKENLTLAAGVVIIESLSEDGSVHESWKLHNPMFTDVTPSALKYDGDALTTISATITYDWAEFLYKGVSGQGGSFTINF